MGSFQLRPYKRGDATDIASIFFDAVREGASDYDAAQRRAWAPSLREPEQYEARIQDGRFVVVAVDIEDRPIAYGELEADGHLDHLYCRPEFIGSGVGATLYDALEQEARRRGLVEVRVEASEAARRLFLKKGFAELGRRDFQLRGTPIHNYAMSKSLIEERPIAPGFKGSAASGRRPGR